MVTFRPKGQGSKVKSNLDDLLWPSHLVCRKLLESWAPCPKVKVIGQPEVCLMSYLKVKNLSFLKGCNLVIGSPMMLILWGQLKTSSYRWCIDALSVWVDTYSALLLLSRSMRYMLLNYIALSVNSSSDLSSRRDLWLLAGCRFDDVIIRNLFLQNIHPFGMNILIGF